MEVEIIRLGHSTDNNDSSRERQDFGSPRQQRLQFRHSWSLQNISWHLQTWNIGGVWGVYEKAGGLTLLVDHIEWEKLHQFNMPELYDTKNIAQHRQTAYRRVQLLQDVIKHTQTILISWFILSYSLYSIHYLVLL